MKVGELIKELQKIDLMLKVIFVTPALENLDIDSGNKTVCEVKGVNKLTDEEYKFCGIRVKKVEED